MHNRLRKRSRLQSRRLSSVLTVPKDDKGEIIHLHTAAYNGDAAAVSSYILQGGDLEVRISVIEESTQYFLQLGGVLPLWSPLLLLLRFCAWS